MKTYNIFIIFVFISFILIYTNYFKFINTNFLTLKDLKDETKIKNIINFKTPLLYLSIAFIFLILYYFIFNINELKIIQTQKEIIPSIPLSNIQKNLILEKTYLEKIIPSFYFKFIFSLLLLLFFVNLWRDIWNQHKKSIQKNEEAKKIKTLKSETEQKEKVSQEVHKQSDEKKKDTEFIRSIIYEIINKIYLSKEKQAKDKLEIIELELRESEKINNLLDAKIKEFNRMIDSFFKYLNDLLLVPQFAEFVTNDNLRSTIDQYYASKKQIPIDIKLETGQSLMLYILNYNIEEDKLFNLNNLEKEELIEKINFYMRIYDEDWSAFNTFLSDISLTTSPVEKDLLDLISDESLTELPIKEKVYGEKILQIETQLTKIDSEKEKLKTYYEKEKLNFNKIQNLEKELILKSDPKQLKHSIDQLKDIKTFESEQKDIIESLILILNQQTNTLFQLESQINYLQLETVQLQELKEKNLEDKTFYETKLTDINDKITIVTKLIEKINDKFEKSLFKLKNMYNILKTIYNVKFNLDFKTYITNYINNNDSLKLELKDNILLQNQTTFLFEVTSPTSFKVNDNFIFLKDIIQSELGAITIKDAIMDNIPKIDLNVPGYLILVFIYLINNYNNIESKDLIPFIEQMKQFKKYINANVFESTIQRKSSNIYSLNNFYIEQKTASYDEITPKFLQKIFVLFFIYCYILKKYFSNKIDYEEIISFFELKNKQPNQTYYTLYLRLKNARQSINCYTFSNKKNSDNNHFLTKSLNSFVSKENIELEFEKIRIQLQPT